MTDCIAAKSQAKVKSLKPDLGNLRISKVEWRLDIMYVVYIGRYSHLNKFIKNYNYRIR